MHLAFHIWSVLPAAVMWVIWRTRNEAIFNEGKVDCDLMLQAVKASLWSWMNISSRALEARKTFTYTDLLYGWRMVMREDW
ncbi:hypothetical protein FRX31_018339 [Thalictrum thalictroides]|uniref:Uncharacterized protein n=1 Tax=Thalictrum thalictroides TaxID=46969 RepID=A0A7J6W3X1_THATH|nr:hypothetical protein FRX31_018339 [Thalictrum thalictroides]